jgi:hypothetical protein
MKNRPIIYLALSLVACAPNDRAATELATRLANEGGNELSQDYRNGYIDCGVKALSHLPREKVDAALRAPDAQSIWAVLGSDALDSYVRACRETDLKRGPPPKQ